MAQDNPYRTALLRNSKRTVLLTRTLSGVLVSSQGATPSQINECLQAFRNSTKAVEYYDLNETKKCHGIAAELPEDKI